MFLTESVWLEPPGLNNLLEQDKSSAWKTDWHRRGVTGARMKNEPLVRCAVNSSCSNYPQSAVSINPVHLVISPVSLFYVSHTFFLVLWNVIVIVSIFGFRKSLLFLWLPLGLFQCLCLATHLLQEGLGSVHMRASMCVVGGGLYDQNLL